MKGGTGKTVPPFALDLRDIMTDSNSVLGENFTTKTFTAEQLAGMGINIKPNDDQVDISVLQAKIDQQNDVISNFTNIENELRAQLTAAKAVNYDLLNALPVHGDEKKLSNEPTDAEDVDIDDLFGDK